MRRVLGGLGIAAGSLAALVGIVWTLTLAWGVWHGGTLKGVGWTVGPHPVLALVLFFAGWEIVATVCYLAVFLPFAGLAALFPDRGTS